MVAGVSPPRRPPDHGPKPRCTPEGVPEPIWNANGFTRLTTSDESFPIPLRSFPTSRMIQNPRSILPVNLFQDPLRKSERVERPVVV